MAASSPSTNPPIVSRIAFNTSDVLPAARMMTPAPVSASNDVMALNAMSHSASEKIALKITVIAIRRARLLRGADCFVGFAVSDTIRPSTSS